jgi:glycosyltransferase involved in cell wall biosynthesis
VGGRLSSLVFGLGLWEDLLRERPILIQTFLLSSPTLFACLAGRMRGVPVVAKLGGSGPFCDLATSRRSPVSRLRLALVLRLADRFVAPSPETLEELCQAGVPRERCVLIPNGVDAGFFSPPEEPPPERARTVLFVGRLEPQKDPATLLEAWRLVRRDHPGARLLVAGSGSLAGALARRAEALALGDSLEWHAAETREEMRRLYHRAAILVLPSLAEGLSNALLEGMASGLAPVASDIPPHRRLFGEGGGLLFPAGDPARLAEALARLLGHDGERESLALAARALARRHDIRATADRYLALYHLLLAGPGGSGRHGEG